MILQQHASAIVALLVLCVVFSGAVSAQEADTGTSIEVTSTSTSDNETVEPIDRNTGLVSSSVEDGTMVLIVESEFPQTVSVTDFGTAMNGHKARIQDVQLQEGRNRIEVPVQSFQGRYAVTLSTRNYAYPIIEDHRSSIIGGPWTVDDVRLSALAAGVSVLLVSILVTVRTITGRTQEPERIA